MICNFAVMKKLFFFALISLLFIVNVYGQYGSVLAQGNWYKIATNKFGIYKLSYSSIKALGVNMNDLQISDLKLYGNGGGMLPQLNSDFRHDDLVENAIKIYDANSNVFLKVLTIFCFMENLPIFGIMMLQMVYLTIKHICLLMR